ncbi:MAG: hypothetical protein KGK07_07190 [Chloroflexota bacterium]|nr:hypothetical protein [Chloroflexota bacterium]
MALPAGVLALPSALRLHFDPSGALVALHIDHHLLASGAVIGGNTRSLTPDGPTAADAFAGDDKTVAFTTRQPPYAGGMFAVRVAGAPVTAGWTQAANANGSVTVTFATAPATGQRVEIVYAIGPGIHGTGGDLSGALTALGVTGAPTKLSELAAIAHGWARAFVQDN